MRRTFVLGLALFASGCIGATFTPNGPSDPAPTPTPTTPNNNDPGAGGSGGSGGGGGAGGTGGSGGSVDPGGPPSQQGSIAVSLPSSADSLRLNEHKDFQVTITPSGGFDGMVQLTVEGMPAGLTATFTPPGAMMAGTAPMTATMTITSASDATPNNTMPLTVTATSGTITSSAALTIDLKAELLVTIATGVNVGSSGSPNSTAFGSSSLPVLFVSPGTKVTFVNEDNINHEIHSDGSLGIQHEGGPLMANAGNSYTQTFNGKGTFNFRCHIHPNMLGQIVVK